jgi:hypothetical protein
MQNRCGLLFLSCIVFVVFNSVSEELWNLEKTAQEGSTQSTASSDAATAPEMYKGEFVLVSNGSVTHEGGLRMTVVSQNAGAMGVRVSSISLSLLSNTDLSRGSFGYRNADFLLKGVEFIGVQRLTATGISDPTGFELFGPDTCRLDAVMEMGAFRPTGVFPAHTGALAEAKVWSSQAHAFGGEITSADCNFSMSFTADTIDIQRVGQKVVHYAIWVNLLTVIQIRCFLAQMRYTEEGPSVAKLSIVCIATQALMDAYNSFLHLSLSASSRYMFNTFAIISLFKFVLFALLEVRYLLTIWRHRRRDVFLQGWDAVRRELSRVYSRFYGILIIGLVLIFHSLEHLDKIALAFQAYWLPQILHDVRQGSKNALHPHFLFGISVTRCFEMIYLWGSFDGVFSGDLYPRLPGAPSLRLCAAVVLLQIVQVGLMVSQRILGPRWFVPWVFLPHVYNYQRPVEAVNEQTDCVICMGDLDLEDPQKRAVTPCSHCFHKECLDRWMDVKMECPTCRAPLPPMS